MFAAQEEKDNCEDELRVSLHKTFLSLPIEEQTALKAAVQLNRDIDPLHSHCAVTGKLRASMGTDVVPMEQMWYR